MRTCKKCGVDRPEEFYIECRPRVCRVCRTTYQREWYQRNSEKALKTNKAWRDKGGREKSKLAVYGLTIEDYTRMLEEQNHVCAICLGKCPSGRKLAVDHCHDTGKVRGLLCTRCNAAIAYFKHNPTHMLSAVDYLTHRGS